MTINGHSDNLLNNKTGDLDQNLVRVYNLKCLVVNHIKTHLTLNKHKDKCNNSSALGMRALPCAFLLGVC